MWPGCGSKSDDGADGESDPVDGDTIEEDALSSDTPLDSLSHDTAVEEGGTDASDAPEMVDDEIPPGCGDGDLDPGEECDDGDLDDCNGCTRTCKWAKAMRVSSGQSGATVPLPTTGTGSICLPDAFTIEAWFKFEGTLTDSDHFVFLQSSEDSYVTRMDFGLGAKRNTAGDWIAAVVEEVGAGAGSSQGGHTAPFLVPGSWHHAAYVSVVNPSDGTKSTYIYFDGMQLNGWVVHGSDETWRCEGTLTLGFPGDAWEHGPFSGILDDVRISSTALYTGMTYAPDLRLGVRTDTVALWDFDEVTGGVVPDASGNGHDANMADGLIVADECHSP
jgi:cysteine-rich repeat protein